MKAVKIKVLGRVLRTGYRWYVVDIARDLGLTGYIELNPEGYLSIHAQGEEKTLEEFLGKLKDPPPPSKVIELSIEDAKLDGKIKSFTIKYGTIGDELHEGFGPIQITLEESFRNIEKKLEDLENLLSEINKKLTELYRSQKST
ncbi:MAG: acylphosphatase [Aigarchaeota archaeon]|nr:acylphosphatase [Aigarchaeota archaeon]MCX8192501.1 acylphosphatase [Nitrososphaeria archaeon]MDW7985763.1 acylphosphatase [Nitrososphaerota archaeon]